MQNSSYLKFKEKTEGFSYNGFITVVQIILAKVVRILFANHKILTNMIIKL